MKSMTGLRKKRIIALAAVALAVILSAIVTFQGSNENLSWKRIYQFFGLSDTSREAESYDLSVHFLDVGKADSIYIRCNGKNILVDAGDVEYTGEVTSYLKRQGVETLDLVVATHFDNDHIGGMANVLLEFQVNQFMMPQLPSELLPGTSAFETMIFALDLRQVPLLEPKLGETLSFNGLDIQILGPDRVYEDMNDNSVILKLEYGQVSFLLMGDAEENAEKNLLMSGYDLGATVLKVGHHGSKTSTAQELLDAVSPQVALISVGEDRNELPKTQVLDRLAENGITVYRTDLNGTVVMSTSGVKLHIFTEKDEE